MKTAEQIITDIARTIAGVYERPEMFVGGMDRPESLEVTLWHLHFIWADALGRADELIRANDDARRAANCGNFGLLDGYRMYHPDAKPRELSEYVLTQWKQISEQMGLPTTSL